MATVGSAKSTLVDKINSLTAAATPKDTIFLAKALGEATSLSNFVWKGTWSTGTEYAIDDVVNEGVSSYVCIQAHTAGATFAGDSAKWNAIAVGANMPSQTGNSGKVLKTDGSSLEWGDGLPTGGSAGQYITTDGSTASWGDVTQKVLKVATATTSGATFFNSTISWNSNLNNHGATHLSINYTPVSSTSTLLIYTNAMAAIESNQRAYQGIRHNGTLVGWMGMNGYAGDTGGGGMSAVVASGSTSARLIELRNLGTADSGAGITLGRAQGAGANRYYPEISSMHIIEVEV